MDVLSLATTLFDRAAHRRKDDEWLAEAWGRASVLQIDADANARVVQDGARSALSLAPSSAVGERRFLGVVDDQPWFSVTVPAHAGSSGSEWQSLRMVGMSLSPVEANLLVAAIALQNWHARHTHCPLCGTPTDEAQAGWIRRCPQDGSDHFPRTDPAVIMLVHDGAGHALLGRSRGWTRNRFSTLAGFVEPGESLESAVQREVFEEVGVVVTDVSYVASQPWPFPSSLMVGFTARTDGMPDIVLDGDEMAEAHWFTAAEIAQAATWTDALVRGESPDIPSDAVLQGISPVFSVSRYLIDGWLHDWRMG